MPSALEEDLTSTEDLQMNKNKKMCIKSLKKKLFKN